MLVTVVADVPWPMQGTIESIMADEAKRTVGKYVDYITKYVEDELNNQLLQQQQQGKLQACCWVGQGVQGAGNSAGWCCGYCGRLGAS